MSRRGGRRVGVGEGVEVDRIEVGKGVGYFK